MWIPPARPYDSSTRRYTKAEVPQNAKPSQYHQPTIQLETLKRLRRNLEQTDRAPRPATAATTARTAHKTLGWIMPASAAAQAKEAIVAAAAADKARLAAARRPAGKARPVAVAASQIATSTRTRQPTAGPPCSRRAAGQFDPSDGNRAHPGWVLRLPRLCPSRTTAGGSGAPDRAARRHGARPGPPGRCRWDRGRRTRRRTRITHCRSWSAGHGVHCRT
jgi:hypothetical protein